LTEHQVYSLYNNELKANITMFTSWKTDSSRQTRNWYDRYIIDYGNNHLEEFQNHIALKAVDQQEMIKLLTFSGFKIVNIFGDFAEEEFNGESERMIVIAQKPSNK
jgi:hypothetical protein